MANEGERALRHAVRARVALRYVGELALVLGLTSLVPILAAVVFGELHRVPPYAVAAAVFFAMGLAARRLPASRDLQPNEALVVTVVAFVLAPLVLSGALAFQGIPWLDALFEAVSGFTTTGLSTLASVEERPRSFLLARAWMQWVGGLGFVVLSLALTLDPGIAARRLGAAGSDPADLAAGMRVHARLVLRIYLGLTLLGVVILAALGASFFDAVVHTLAGVSTGGFAPRDDSLASFGTRLQCGVLGVALLGAVSLPLYAELRRGRWRRVRDDAEVRALVLLVAVFALLLYAATRVGHAGDAVGPADLGLLAVSAQTTAGFSTVEVAELPAGGKLLMIVSMLTGGSQGSTAGGIKLLRILMVLRLLQWQIVRTRLPAHAVSAPRLSGARLEPPQLLGAAVVLMLFLGVVLVSWLPFLAAGYAPLDALFEVASAAGTVGLSVGITRPELEPFLKAVLCVNMLLGRLEVFAVLVAVAPRTWIGRRRS